ncbi:aminotransferase class I/II-fold pyridoxal phosphate-dependent enzyme [Candidatus Woesearchaeota archaeon]|nr:aminotransferase class I/II-fold pyridoxal phosphate-dependent enzyme [Candidatus Woesearchaeota archaeon]
MNPQAEELNETIKRSSMAAYGLLSKKGKAIFFPKRGILSQSAEAKGKKINATIGIALEDDGSPMRLKPIADKIKLDPKDVFPYSPSFGMKELREKWKDMMIEKNPSLKGKCISLPVVTNAITHGLSITGYMFVDEGDKIILPDLFWGNYKLILANGYGAILDTFETFKGDMFNVDGLREKLKEGAGKKIVLLNFPNNPAGYSPTKEEAIMIRDAIKEAAEKGNRILAIADDAYFGLVYKEGVYTESIFSEFSGLHENVLGIKLDGATKEDYAWGLRVGFITYGLKKGSEELYGALESKASGAVRGSISNDSHLSQSLVSSAFSDPGYDKEKKEKRALLKKRFDEVENALSAHKEYEEEFSALPHNSGYFMCVKLKNKEGEEIRQRLLKKYDTGVIAIGNILRIAFSSIKTESVKKVFENIYMACKE